MYTKLFNCLLQRASMHASKHSICTLSFIVTLSADGCHYLSVAFQTRHRDEAPPTLTFKCIFYRASKCIVSAIVSWTNIY